MIWDGLYERPFSRLNLSAMAWRSSGVPLAGVYLVNPSFSALIAASLICWGVSKSGSPAPNPTTSCPSAFICLALESIARVKEGDRAAARCEILYCIPAETNTGLPGPVQVGTNPNSAALQPALADNLDTPPAKPIGQIIGECRLQ